MYHQSLGYLTQFSLCTDISLSLHVTKQEHTLFEDLLFPISQQLIFCLTRGPDSCSPQCPWKICLCLHVAGPLTMFCPITEEDTNSCRQMCFKKRTDSYSNVHRHTVTLIIAIMYFAAHLYLHLNHVWIYSRYTVVMCWCAWIRLAYKNCYPSIHSLSLNTYMDRGGVGGGLYPSWHWVKVKPHPGQLTS